MNWSGPAEFFAMGGYALYVWGSFAMCAIVIATETILVIGRRKKVLRELQAALQPELRPELQPELRPGIQPTNAENTQK